MNEHENVSVETSSLRQRVSNRHYYAYYSSAMVAATVLMLLPASLPQPESPALPPEPEPAATIVFIIDKLDTKKPSPTPTPEPVEQLPEPSPTPTKTPTATPEPEPPTLPAVRVDEPLPTMPTKHAAKRPKLEQPTRAVPEALDLALRENVDLPDSLKRPNRQENQNAPALHRPQLVNERLETADMPAKAPIKARQPVADRATSNAANRLKIDGDSTGVLLTLGPPGGTSGNSSDPKAPGLRGMRIETIGGFRVAEVKAIPGGAAAASFEAVEFARAMTNLERLDPPMNGKVCMCGPESDCVSVTFDNPIVLRFKDGLLLLISREGDRFKLYFQVGAELDFSNLKRSELANRGLRALEDCLKQGLPSR